MKSRISVSYLTYRYLTKQAPVFVSICNLVIVIVSNRGKTDITGCHLIRPLGTTCFEVTKNDCNCRRKCVIFQTIYLGYNSQFTCYYYYYTIINTYNVSMYFPTSIQTGFYISSRFNCAYSSSVSSSVICSNRSFCSLRSFALITLAELPKYS